LLTAIPVSVRVVPVVPRHRKILGDRIRLYRKLSQMTQERLAEKAELAPTYLSDVERGRENISVDATARVARALGVELHDLFREK
jgi:transcriptional regulator with XRE-family HTH domain